MTVEPTLLGLLANRENVHLEGHAEWDAGYLSGMALVEAYLPAHERSIRAAALREVAEAVRFPRNVRIFPDTWKYGEPALTVFEGDWVAVPLEDFDTARAILTEATGASLNDALDDSAVKERRILDRPVPAIPMRPRCPDCGHEPHRAMCGFCDCVSAEATGASE